jgi:hypothetical protein
MGYESSEAEIVQQLSPLISGSIDVLPIPESQDDLRKSILRPRVWVAYNGTNYQPSQSSGNIVQEATITFEVVVQSKKLRGPTGVYVVLELIKLLLVGFRPTELNLLYLANEELIQLDDHGVWNYRQVYSCKTRQVQANSGEADVILHSIQVGLTATNGIDLPTE